MKYGRFINPRKFIDTPPDWNEIFPNPGKLMVEIGFGSGEFLCSKAIENPEHNFVGFETSLLSVVKTLNRLEALSLDNVVLALLDGRFALRELFSDESVNAVFANFPCPWPKKRHAKRRLITEDFVSTLSAVLEKNGHFELVTDVKWLAEEAREMFQKNGCFEPGELEIDPVRKVQTKYERKWLSQGKRIYRLVVRKKSRGHVERMVTWEMPHLHIKTPDLSNLERFVDTVYQESDKTFVIKDVYADIKNENYLFLIFSTDRGFQQEYYLRLARKKEGGWILKLDSTTVPFRTPAVKWSVAKIGELLGQP